MEEQIENIPRSILQNIQSIVEGLENFISLVNTVYIVGKELRSMIFKPPSPKSDLYIVVFFFFSWKQLV